MKYDNVRKLSGLNIQICDYPGREIVKVKELDDTNKEGRERVEKMSKNRAFGKFLYLRNRSKKLFQRS